MILLLLQHLHTIVFIFIILHTHFSYNIIFIHSMYYFMFVFNSCFINCIYWYYNVCTNDIMFYVIYIVCNDMYISYVNTRSLTILW